MSNYANTKATIAANVYENHLNQVTANMAKAAMNSIVDALIAGGFLYKGVAHPGDPAITSDANIFVIATEAGTYTNFKNSSNVALQVADGEVAILKYNGSWSKEVTGAATAAEVSALGQEVDELIQTLPLKALPGAVMGSGTWEIGSYTHWVIPVNGGEKLMFDDASGVMYCLFLASYTTPVAGETPDYCSGYTGRQTLLEVNGATLPSDCRFLVVNNPSGNYLPSSLILDGIEFSNGIHSTIVDLCKEVKENKDEYDAEINGTTGTRAVSFTQIDNRILKPTTVDVLNNWAITDYIDISQMWKVRVVATQFPGSPYVSVQMYDVNKAIQQDFVGISTDTTITNNGWYYMRVSFRYSNSGTLSVEEIFDIPGLEERVSTLEGAGLGKINKDICFVGMSIWWYDGKTLAPGVGGGVTAVGYQTILAEQFGFGTKRNYCYSGYSLGATDSEDTSSIALNKISELVGGNGDLWTLDTITNDFKRNIPIGTISDYNNNTGATTYYGALRIFADRVVSQSGQGAIVVVSNGCRRNNSGYTSTSANANGDTMLDFEYAIAQVAMLNGWYYVDQYRCELTDEIVMLATIDGLHLNNFGYRLAVKPWVEQFNIIARTL